MGDGAYNGGVEVEFDGVYFAYPTMSEHKVLRGTTLKIPAGKTVSLVGQRGCGKTSTLELIQRKYDVEPGEGSIKVNGRPIQEWDVRQYRRRLSVVAQGPKIFANTIKENILYGLSDQERLQMGFDGPEASTTGHQELKRICELACCWDFVKDFPLQLETRIGCGGIKLSGGQTQCLTIARALIKKPAFLILDEATAALDNETQKKVAENISKLQKQQGFTIVQIAHRLTTLTDSDIIYFLDHGTVAETGGLHSQNGSAVDELNKIDIAHRTVLNPETGEEEQRIDRGFFHHHWNAANDIKAFHEMNAGKLSEKVRELRCELDVARAELGKRNAAKLLPPLLLERALTHPASSSCRHDDISDHGSTTPPSSETCDFCDASSDEDMTCFPESTPVASGTIASLLSAPKLSRAITCPAA
jgi:ABC-type glutathione transport system ATPase component